MNIYEKLQIMRCELQGMSLKKSGKNTFAGYQYFELGDFLPAINGLMLTHKVSSSIQFGADIVSLVLVNTEKPEDIVYFTCPMASASLKGCHPVQNLGASITYIRRYLYINAFEIVENDAVDSSEPTQSTPKSHRKDATSDSTPTSRGQDADGDMRTAITIMLGEMCNGDKEAIQCAIEKITGFQGKDGWVSRSSVDELRGKYLFNTFTAIKKDYDHYKSANPSPTPDLNPEKGHDAI